MIDMPRAPTPTRSGRSTDCTPAALGCKAVGESSWRHLVAEEIVRTAPADVPPCYIGRFRFEQRTSTAPPIAQRIKYRTGPSLDWREGSAGNSLVVVQLAMNLIPAPRTLATRKLTDATLCQRRCIFSARIVIVAKPSGYGFSVTFTAGHSFILVAATDARERVG